MRPMSWQTPQHIAEALWSYGEDDAEQRVRVGLTDEQHRQISVEAGKIAFA